MAEQETTARSSITPIHLMIAVVAIVGAILALPWVNGLYQERNTPEAKLERAAADYCIQTLKYTRSDPDFKGCVSDEINLRKLQAQSR
jgi:small-conductance mechanosensitive channel